ncbi:hypothetical protein BCT16_01140 [Vibrio sp. 10N.222.54.B6]|jgi:hypothetical protein|nr:hypothetical protein A138_04695 [Vibrio crassostreae 9ZC77]PMK24384.1 hypothetical protein BCU05_07955 [Vibrio sp. 10N.261.54.C3]PMK81954.1 hypothetical protein BCT92_00850 [Vibrio sp. 10N.261.52.E5]PMN99914.1 hypothetical protein BCT20_14325 [Vibrio sp. 10N.222.55.C12]PMO13331.1 hypothetical protein BCT17_14835 [Vibrio sp. 10N.222.54.F10]PMO21373.1 hypothetical protein BCT16_01140 [Vibrio sp. 10N.222.54.B6]
MSNPFFNVRTQREKPKQLENVSNTNVRGHVDTTFKYWAILYITFKVGITNATSYSNIWRNMQIATILNPLFFTTSTYLLSNF